MGEQLLLYLTDPVLRGPTIGSMLMCLASALVGVILFMRKQSLVGEVLSHAAYPGIVLGVIAAGIFSIDANDIQVTILVLTGAAVTAWLGVLSVQFLENKVKIKSDSALCFVLSIFFGIGLTLASATQFSYTTLYRQAQSYLYGQAATMTDTHIIIYGSLACCVIAIFLLLGKEIRAITFNLDYAKSLGIKVNWVNNILAFLIVISVVIGIRSVGVVLMSAMLIAPATAARQYTNRFYSFLFIAALFGALSGYFGNFLSSELSTYLSNLYPTQRLSIPTGPMIVLVASSICIFSLLFAPERGLLLRFFRIARFRYGCLRENLLKTIWRLETDEVTFQQIAQYQSASNLYMHFMLSLLCFQGWLDKTRPDHYRLTKEGRTLAARIVRLHRLWEVYLVDYLGTGAERVHRNAEEMEHILTPELEIELTKLLKDPKVDPHHQKIPPIDSETPSFHNNPPSNPGGF